MRSDKLLAGSNCRLCGEALQNTFVDLGSSPLCESYLSGDQLMEGEMFYPLHVWVCDSCWLVQLDEFVSPSEIFSEYAYFSSYSDTWVEHARQYTAMAIDRFGIGPDSRVVEIASNDGYLLQHFVTAGVPVLGVEPAANVAAVAIERGVSTTVRFFGVEAARDLVADGKQADLIVANNVVAHVPDLHDLLAGMKLLLKPDGTVTAEFPHLLKLMDGNQFDTIYHEHFSYLSLIAADAAFASEGLRVFDVEELSTHGGSLRVFACHHEAAPERTGRATDLLNTEILAGFTRLDTYSAFTAQVAATKRALLKFLIEAKENGKTVAAYGAPGKGNTLLNYCGIRTDLIDYAVDRNEYKQGRHLPGTRIPIFAPDHIHETRPDFVLILPWNLKDEIADQMAAVSDWGCQFVVPIPSLEVFPAGGRACIEKVRQV